MTQAREDSVGVFQGQGIYGPENNIQEYLLYYSAEIDYLAISIEYKLNVEFQ